MQIENNARICCFGDSWMEHAWWITETLNCLATYCPEKHIKLFNCGWGGDSAFRAQKRLFCDVLDKRPTHFFVNL